MHCEHSPQWVCVRVSDCQVRAQLRDREIKCAQPAPTILLTTSVFVSRTNWFSTPNDRSNRAEKKVAYPASVRGCVVRDARAPITYPTGGRFRLVTPFS